MTKFVLRKKTEIHEAIKFIRKTTDFQPRLALILGSGLGSFGDRINAIATIRSSEIPNYPVSTIQGHAGKLIFGFLQNDIHRSMPLLIFQGRVHFYEFGCIERVVFPIIISHQLGVKKLIITNASGGINNSFNAGDLMLIRDILNLADVQLPKTLMPSVLPIQRYSDYFDSEMKNIVLQCASQIEIPLRQGTYGWLRGPSYETPAEIQMLKRIGVDAVGMSTIPEIFLARNLGMKIAGISLISNLAAGISSGKLSHAEVTETGTKVTGCFSELMEQVVLSLNQ